MHRNNIGNMPRTVYITTPMPTLEEVAKKLGLSKKRQQAIIAIMRRDVRTEGHSGKDPNSSRTVSKRRNAEALRTAAKR
jgi:hypothetical protein